MKARGCIALVAVCLAGAAGGAQDHQHGGSTAGVLGTVSFTTSCSEAAQPLFNRAVALLHSFEFGRAIEGFGSVLKTDPACAMAEWGIAASRWSNPFAVGVRGKEPLRLGREAVERARAIGLKTDSERGYVDAIALLYEQADTVDQLTRLVSYRDAMAALASRYRGDSEASIFYALS